MSIVRRIYSPCPESVIFAIMVFLMGGLHIRLGTFAIFLSNEMPLDLRTEGTLLSRLEEQFKLNCDRPALKTKSTIWSYGELDSLTASCACALEERIPDASAPVALLMKHDAALVGAIISVLRSGGFYVALNPAFPMPRLRQIMSEVCPRVIITDREHDPLARQLIESRRKRFLVDELMGAEGYYSTPEIAPGAPCALFYTSGSSGRPRPLAYTYAGTFLSVANHMRLLSINSEDRITLLSPCSAAASATAILGALLNGACLLPFQPALEGLNKMEDWIKSNDITIYHSVPSLFRRFVQSLAPEEVLSSIRIVKLGGETVFPADVELFREHFTRSAILINGLGLTEANGNVCHFRVRWDTNISSATVPVGQPDEGVEFKLVDADSGEVASNHIGEIALRGRQIAPAYWTGSTIKSYGLNSANWFHTGDLGRRNADGNLEYLGRKDGQLRLRGQWVGIAEIEATLTRLPGIKTAVVVPVEVSKEEKKIAAFLVCNKSAINEQELRDSLTQQFPSYSVPNYFFFLPQLPLLPNAKVDRLALSQQARQRLIRRSKVEFDPPDKLIDRLVKIWRKALANDAIGPADDFFISGGDSLAAVAMLAAIEKSLGIKVPTSTLLEAPTPRKLAEFIRKGEWPRLESSLVAVQSLGNRPPLYCVPGAGAEALQFRELAGRLGDDQPIFAFQPQGLNGPLPFDRSVEAMAADYVRLLRAHQRQGPYHLCGASFGGLVAIEIARTLLEMGDKVHFLGLFDTYNTSKRPHLKALAVTQSIAKDKGVSWESFKWWVKVKAVRCYVHLNRGALVARPFRWRLLYFREICYAAGARYTAKLIALKIDLFRAEHQPSSQSVKHDSLLGWDGLASKGIEVHRLPGDHASLVREPNVSILARELRLCLERT